MKARNGGTLPAALVRRLGEVPDEVLAVRHQIPVGRITRERLRRGIPAYNRLAWNEAEVALLGTMSDAAVARLLGVTTNAVYQRRAALGIAAFGRSNAQKQHRWTARQLAELGQVPDAALARELGISGAVVRDKRLTLGIEARPGARGRKPRPFTKAEIRKLGRAPDRVVAAEVHRGRHEVAAKRRSLGIPAFAPTAPRKGARKRKAPRPTKWTPDVIARLGTVTDAQLAAELGLTRQAVHAQRAKRGVPPAR